ncbi:MAG TPA: hypothetical protein VIN40_00250 [Candidatus Tyrphobacter sp.]
MSSATLALDIGLLRDLEEPSALLRIARDEIPTLASRLELLASIVEENWESLPQPLRDLAVAYAYYDSERYATEPLARLKAAAASVRLLWRGIAYRGEMVRLMTAIVRLNDAIFTALERESPEYREHLATRLEGPFTGEEMTGAQLREWMHKI